MKKSLPSRAAAHAAARVLLAGAALGACAQSVTAPPIAAKAYIVVDVLSGQTLAAANENDRFDPASLTKLMTGYVVFAALRERKLDPAQSVAVSENASKADGSRMFLAPGKPVAVADLLRGMIVQSGNDASIALAEAIAGSEEAFAAEMNRQAERLGLANTHFANATGKPAPGHQSTARDLATLAAAVLRDFPDQYPLYAQKEFTWNRISQTNRNRLLWTDPTVDGVKTGFTEAAGYCLIASAKRGERRLISVVLGAQSDLLRTSESQKLLNFGFQSFETRRLYRKGEPVATPEIYKGTKSAVRLGFDRDVWLTLPRERFAGLAATLETRQPFVAPLAAGQKAGIMKLTRDNAPVAEFPVVALDEVPVAGFLSRGWDTLRLLFLRSP
jgi:D-alanyl-D-alanine carboxypeptidase (penicillin-binding protein 5/6)